MRVIYFLLISIIHIPICLSDGTIEDEPVVDAKFVEYEEAEDLDFDRQTRKETVSGIKNFVGTNLFGECRKKCFSNEDIALLAARRDFESLLPKELSSSVLDDELAKILMRYFYGANEVIEKLTDGISKMITQKAFHDAMGGYLKSYLIPMSKNSFYAGLLKLRTVTNILALYEECKDSLNTNGNGWKAPLDDLSDIESKIEPLKIVIQSEDEDTSCTQLELDDGENDDNVIVPIPHLEPEEKGVLGNILLPFKRKKTFNLQACSSAFILLKYFELTTRCYKFQNVCQDTFNKKFKDWILENIEVHLADEVLYPGLGAVLRIVETLHRKTKGTVLVDKFKKSTKKREDEVPIESGDRAETIHRLTAFQKVLLYPFTSNLEPIPLKTDWTQNKIFLIVLIFTGFAIILLAIMAFVYCQACLWWKCGTQPPNDDDKDKSADQTPQAKPKKKSFWSCRKKKKDDEEALLNPNSPSVASGDSKNPAKGKKSKEEKVDEKEVKKKKSGCMPCRKKSQAAVIEPTPVTDEKEKNKAKKDTTQPSQPTNSTKKEKPKEAPNSTAAKDPGSSKNDKKSPGTITVATATNQKRFSISKKFQSVNTAWKPTSPKSPKPNLNTKKKD